jgi:hypothetical protein
MGTRGQPTPTFSMCCSSPRVKLSISSAFLMRTVPFVSVWAISKDDVKTATLALRTFLIWPVINSSKKSRQHHHAPLAIESLPNQTFWFTSKDHTRDDLATG